MEQNKNGKLAKCKGVQLDTLKQIHCSWYYQGELFQEDDQAWRLEDNSGIIQACGCTSIALMGLHIHPLCLPPCHLQRKFTSFFRTIFLWLPSFLTVSMASSQMRYDMMQYFLFLRGRQAHILTRKLMSLRIYGAAAY